MTCKKGDNCAGAADFRRKSNSSFQLRIADSIETPTMRPVEDSATLTKTRAFWPCSDVSQIARRDGGVQAGPAERKRVRQRLLSAGQAAAKAGVGQMRESCGAEGGVVPSSEMDCRQPPGSVNTRCCCVYRLDLEPCQGVRESAALSPGVSASIRSHSVRRSSTR